MTAMLLFLLAAHMPAPSPLPDLNAKVVEYVHQNMGKKVDRGQCWDLTAGALAHSNAYFDRSSKKTIWVFGRQLDPKKDEILPGDIIQFESVEMKWAEGNRLYQTFLGLPNHTAIVYEVNSPGDYQIAHQNAGDWGKKVGVNNFRLDRVTKGRMKFYRPVSTKEEM